MAATEKEVISDDTRDDDARHTHDGWEDVPTFDALRVTIRKRNASIARHSATFRRAIQDRLDSLWLQSFIMGLVVFDLVLGLSSVIQNEDTVRTLTLILILIYCIEIALRIYGYGINKYFKSVLNVVDFIAVSGRFHILFFCDVESGLFR